MTPQSQQSDATKFASKSLAAIVIKIGAAGLSFVMFVALARALPQAEFGQFGFAFSLATFLAVLGSFGQRNLVLRFASIYIADGKDTHAFAVIRNGFKLVFFGAGALSLCLLVAAALPYFSDQRAILIATAGLTLVLAIGEFQPHVLRAAGRVWTALLPRDILLRIGMIGFALLAITGWIAPKSAPAAIAVMCLLLAILVMIQAAFLKFTNPFTLLYARIDLSEQGKWRNAMWGLWGNSVVNASGRNVAIVIMGLILPALATGAVFAALRTAMVLELFLIAINIVAAPMLASLLARGSIAQAQTICTRISLMLGLPTLAIFLIFVFAGRHVLELFGAGYASAHTELIIFSAGYLVSAFAGPTTQLMEMGGHERVYFRMLSVTTGLALAILPVAAILFGGVGAAICVAFNLIALNIWAYIFIYRTMGISPGVVRLAPRTGAA